MRCALRLRHYEGTVFSVIGCSSIAWWIDEMELIAAAPWLPASVAALVAASVANFSLTFSLTSSLPSSLPSSLFLCGLFSKHRWGKRRLERWRLDIHGCVSVGVGVGVVGESGE